MPTQEIIDPAAFARFFEGLGGEVEFLDEVIEEYLASSPGLFTSMQQAIAARDAPALQRAAHSLKTGSATFGALAFAAQCKELEDIGKMGALDSAEEKFRALEASYLAVVAALHAQRQNAHS